MRNEDREECLRGDLEEKGQNADEEGDEQQQLQVEDAGDGGEWDGQQEGGTAEIGGDEDGSAAMAVDPDADEETEEEGGDTTGRAEKPHLERGRVQGDDSDEREGEEGDLGAEQGDTVADPEHAEAASAPETAER